MLRANSGYYSHNNQFAILLVPGKSLLHIGNGVAWHGMACVFALAFIQFAPTSAEPNRSCMHLAPSFDVAEAVSRARYENG